ncbi:MAG: hypothetical protein AAF610_06765 [Pseudomonadota bacterium]
MKQILCAAAMTAILAGCASSGTTSSTASVSKTAAVQKTEEQQFREDEIRCTRETRTGSHRKTRVCRSVEQRRRDREDAQRTLDVIQNGGTNPNAGT